MDDNLLSAEFVLYPKKLATSVTLTNHTITINKKQEKNEDPEVIQIDDVIGCHVLKGNETTGANWYLCLFCYPLKKKVFKKLMRCRFTKSLGIACFDTDEENKALAEKWKKVIKHLISGSCFTKEQINHLPEVKQRKVIVYVNPFSGRGKALQIYNSQVKSFFGEAEIKHTVVKTEYSGHARNLTRELELQKYDGMIIVSGDGLVYEVINGLMERPDWEEAIKIPIGIVPGGSGNALAASVVYASTGQIISDNLVRDSLYEIGRFRTRDLSLIYAQAGSRNFYSFLNFAWGFMADVDIESENYRRLGDFRFTLGCIVRVANLRKYQGMISYIPAKESHLWRKQKNNCISESTGKTRGSSMIDSQGPSVLSSHENISGSNSKCTSENRDLQKGTSIRNDPANKVLCNDTSNEERVAFTTETIQEEITHVGDVAELLVVPATPSFKDAPVIDHNIPAEVSVNLKEPPYNLTVAVDKPLPEKWRFIEGDFVWVMPVYLSHIGRDMYVMPHAKMGEDIIYIYCIKHGVSKSKLVQILLSFEQGNHLELDDEHTILIPCKAFRLEPFVRHTGCLTSDGELIEYGPLQASTTAVKAKVLCSHEQGVV